MPVNLGSPGTPSDFFIATLLLDHLIAVADGGTHAYPDSVVKESIFAYLMSKSADPVVTDYNNTTDSLQAQRDNFDGVVGAINTAAATGAVTDTDLIMAYIKQLVTNTYRLTEAADGTDKYPASWAQDSALAKLATKSDPAVISGYDNTTDSLEAIRDLLDSFLIDHLLAAADGTDVYPASVAEDSLFAKILGKGNPAVATSFDNTTDSLEALSDKLAAMVGATGILHEQADVPVTINSIAASETNVFDLSTASTRYVVRNLRLKSADPGVDTVTVKLYELINDVQVAVDSFAITTANAGDYHSLMDMFGVPALAGDNLKVTVQSSANTYAITGQYNYAKTNV